MLNIKHVLLEHVQILQHQQIKRVVWTTKQHVGIKVTISLVLNIMIVINMSYQRNLQQTKINMVIVQISQIRLN